MVEPLQGVGGQVQRTEHPHTVARYLLDLIAVESQRVKVLQLAELSHLFQVKHVISVEVKSAKLPEIVDDFIFNSLEVVVAEVQPQQVASVEHHIVKHFVEAGDGPKLVLLQEQRSRRPLNHDFASLTRSFGLLFIDLLLSDSSCLRCR